MSLSNIDDGSVWWLWMKGVVGDSCLASGLMYRLMRSRVYVAKSCIGGEWVWFSMDLERIYLSHSHVNCSSGFVAFHVIMYLYCG